MAARRQPARRTATAKAGRPRGGAWRMAKLPATERIELKKRIAEAKRGDTLLDFDEAMTLAERLTGELLSATEQQVLVASDSVRRVKRD